MAASEPLGIVAGAGELPLALGRAVRDDGRAVFVLALEGIADPAAVAEFPHAWASVGEVGRAITLLKEAGCAEVTLAGRVTRLEFAKLKLDHLGTKYISDIMGAAQKGDDALLRAVIAIFDKQGLSVIGSADVTRSLLAPTGALGRFEPKSEDRPDIRHGLRVVNALGALDIGQAAVVCAGLVLAVEAAEGTDAMLTRVPRLPPSLRGSASGRRGVLVKAVKPRQERRVDLPVIGATTIELAAAAGLSGVAVQAGAVLILNRQRVACLADDNGMFVYGVEESLPAG
jgi:UDP-2,3-diacylglucosamine hydrolase